MKYTSFKNGKKPIFVVIVVFSAILVTSVVSAGKGYSPNEEFATIYTTLLAAAAIIFAIGFADVRYWPSLRYVAKRSGLTYWVIFGTLTTVAQATLGWVSPPYFTVVIISLWIITTITGVITCIKILSLSDSKVMNNIMAQRLSSLSPRDDERFRDALLESIYTGHKMRVMDLITQMAIAATANGPDRNLLNLIQKTYDTLVTTLMVNDDTYETLQYFITRILKLASPDSCKMATDSLYRKNFLAMTYMCNVNLGKLLISVPVAKHKNYITENKADLIFTTTLQAIKNNRELYDAKSFLALTGNESLLVWSSFNQRLSSSGLHSIYTLYQHYTGNYFKGDYWKGGKIIEKMLRRARAKLRTDVIVYKDLKCTLEAFITAHLSLIIARDVMAIKTVGILSEGELHGCENATPAGESDMVEQIRHSLESLRYLCLSFGDVSSGANRFNLKRLYEAFLVIEKMDREVGVCDFSAQNKSEISDALSAGWAVLETLIHWDDDERFETVTSKFFRFFTQDELAFVFTCVQFLLNSGHFGKKKHLSTDLEIQNDRMNKLAEKPYNCDEYVKFIYFKSSYVFEGSFAIFAERLENLYQCWRRSASGSTALAVIIVYPKASGVKSGTWLLYASFLRFFCSEVGWYALEIITDDEESLPVSGSYIELAALDGDLFQVSPVERGDIYQLVKAEVQLYE